MLKQAVGQGDRPSVKTSSSMQMPVTGLLGFGCCAVLFALFQAQSAAANPWLLAAGIVYGGGSLILTGLRQWQKKAGIGALTCVVYGLFWLSLVGFTVLPQLGFGVVSRPMVLCDYYFLWCSFSVLLLVGNLKLLQFFQLPLVFLIGYFVLFSCGVIFEVVLLRELSSYLVFVSGALACYSGVAKLVNRLSGQTLLPLGQAR
ncbi:MAG: acetate uptake transporter [Desulfuromonadaceae bacterium]|jgi:uncharacterized protein